MKSRRVLIVSAALFAATSLRTELESQRCQVEVIASGISAIREVWKESYDEVIVDRRFSGMRVQKLAAHLRQIAPEVEVTVLEKESQDSMSTTSRDGDGQHGDRKIETSSGM